MFRHYISYGIENTRKVVSEISRVRQSRALNKPGWNVLKAGICGAGAVVSTMAKISVDTILYIWLHEGDE